MTLLLEKEVVPTTRSRIVRPHLSADGPAALAGARVEVMVEQNAGVVHVQLRVGVQTGLQSLQPSKHHQKVPGKWGEKFIIWGLGLL